MCWYLTQLVQAGKSQILKCEHIPPYIYQRTTSSLGKPSGDCPVAQVMETAGREKGGKGMKCELF